MSFSIEQGKKLLEEFHLTERELAEQLSDAAGELLDYGPDDFGDPQKRLDVVIATLTAITRMLRKR